MGFLLLAPAQVTPTAMPSGMLCIVTAKSIMAVLENRPLSNPSGFVLFKCRCGTMLSISKRKTMPKAKPIKAGNQEILPRCRAKSIDGINSDQTEAAIITPAGKSQKNFLLVLDYLIFHKKHGKSSKLVPINGIASMATSIKYYLLKVRFLKSS